MLKKVWLHFKLITKHRWIVFKLCIRAGIPWRGFVHDLSKFSKDEFFENVSKKMLGYVLAGVLVLSPVQSAQVVMAAEIDAQTQKSMELSLNANRWGAAYGMNAVLTNNTGKNVDDWKITFQKEIDIESIWCAQSKVVDGKTVVTPLDWNKKVGAMSTVTFGYNGVGTPDENMKYEISYLIDGVWSDGTISSDDSYDTLAGEKGNVVYKFAIDQWNGGYCTAIRM